MDRCAYSFRWMRSSRSPGMPPSRSSISRTGPGHDGKDGSMKKRALQAIIAASFVGAVLFLLATGPAGVQAGSLPHGKRNGHPKVESILTDLEDQYLVGPLRAQAFVRD